MVCTHKVRLFFSQNHNEQRTDYAMKKGHTQKIKKSLFCSHSLPQYYYEIPTPSM